MNNPMELQVQLFAGVRDAAGCDHLAVTVEAGATAGDVLAALETRCDNAAGLIRVSRLAVDGQYVPADHSIDHSDREIALIPPVSGG